VFQHLYPAEGTGAVSDGVVCFWFLFFHFATTGWCYEILDMKSNLDMYQLVIIK
jgi:hypothetical protein